MRPALPELVLVAIALACYLLGHGTFAAAAVGYEPGPPDPNGLRVVTWNLGSPVEGGGRPLREEHLAEVARKLFELQPDVMLLQELAGNEQLERLAAQSAVKPHVAWSPDGSDSLGAIAGRGTLAPLSVKRGGRRPPLSVLYQPHGRQPVHIVAVHASPFSSRRRNRDVGRAVELLEDEPLAEARILCGDLNLDLDPGGRGDLFTDDEHLDVETYNFVARHLRDSAPERGPTAEPDRRLDYVFYRDSALELVDGGPVFGCRVGDMDHRPVVVDFAYRE